jgi:hypothetical protein
MEYAKTEMPQEIKQPDFQKLLESLRKETAIANELTSKVSYLSNDLKRIERKPIPENGAGLSKEPQGVIEHLWEQVWNLRRSNEEMEVVANHLQSIIGN